MGWSPNPIPWCPLWDGPPPHNVMSSMGWSPHPIPWCPPWDGPPTLYHDVLHGYSIPTRTLVSSMGTAAPTPYLGVPQGKSHPVPRSPPWARRPAGSTPATCGGDAAGCRIGAHPSSAAPAQSGGRDKEVGAHRGSAGLAWGAIMVPTASLPAQRCGGAGPGRAGRCAVPAAAQPASAAGLAAAVWPTASPPGRSSSAAVSAAPARPPRHLLSPLWGENCGAGPSGTGASRWDVPPKCRTPSRGQGSRMLGHRVM